MRGVSGLICDRRIATRWKRKVYKMAVRPACDSGADKNTGSRAGSKSVEDAPVS